MRWQLRRELVVPAVVSIVFLALCFTVSWLFVGVAFGSLLPGLQYAWKHTTLGTRLRRSSRVDSRRSG